MNTTMTDTTLIYEIDAECELCGCDLGDHPVTPHELQTLGQPGDRCECTALARAFEQGRVRVA